MTSGGISNLPPDTLQASKYKYAQYILKGWPYYFYI